LKLCTAKAYPLGASTAATRTRYRAGGQLIRLSADEPMICRTSGREEIKNKT
jgi:hypothetical protein